MVTKVTILPVTVNVPVYVKVNGQEIEIGTVEMNIAAHTEYVPVGDDEKGSDDQ